MFSFGPIKATKKRPDWVVIVNHNECNCLKSVAGKLSPTIKLFLKNNPNAKSFECDIGECEIQRDLIASLFFGKEIQFSRTNMNMLLKLSKALEMSELQRDLLCYQDYLLEIESMVNQSVEINELLRCEEIIFNFSFTCLDSTLHESLKFINPTNEDVFVRTLLSFCVARHEKIEQLIEFLTKIDQKQIENGQRTTVNAFCTLVLKEFNKEVSSFGVQRYDEYRSILQELCFILNQLFEKKYLSFDALRPNEVILPLYFAHLMNPQQLRNAQNANIFNKEDRFPVFTQILRTTASKDWIPVHDFNVRSGVNTFPLLLYIRQDDIRQFSGLARLPSFKNDEKVQNSVYERCSFVNDKPKLIEYAAFFGSVECFKFLLASGSEKTPAILRYAICSGNPEIVKLCDEPNCTLLGTLSLSVEYHRQIISEWLIEAKNQSCYDPIVIQNCLRFCNFGMMAFILKKGVNANLFLLETVHYDNILATRWLLKIRGINVNQQDTKRGFTPLHYACQNGNTKMVELLLEANALQINSRTVFIILYFSTNN